MFKSMLVTAVRAMYRHSSFTLINLTGLAVSMSLALLIMVIVKNQYTFDNFHVDAERIYRVNTRAIRTNGEREPYASVPFPLGQVLKDEYSFVEKIVRLNRQLNSDAIYGNVNVPVHGLFADPSFFEVFNFPFEKGDPVTALRQPNSLVITREAAHKIFGIREPLGQTISLSGYGEFVITGVLKKFLGKTHLDFEILASTAALPLLEKKGVVMASLDNWNNYYMGYVYIKLKDGRPIGEVEQALDDISRKFYANLKLEIRDKGYEFYLHPLSGITPGPELSNQMGQGLPDILLVFLSSLAAVIMIMACFNYTNLMIAKSISRAREIAVRKVIGALRWQVFLQFITEAVVFSLLSLVISYILMQMLKPALLQLHIASEFSVDLNEDYILYLMFIGFAIGVGIIAGLLPAGYLSAYRPNKVLKDAGNFKIYSKMTFRKMLMVAQFALSLIFIVVVLVIYRQVDFVLHADYGFKDTDKANVRLQGMSFTKLANEVKKLPGIVSVGGISHSLGTWQDRSSDYRRSPEDEPFEMRDFMVDENYLVNLDISFVAGQNFISEGESGREKHIILNESALPLFGFQDPPSALGQAIYVNDSVMLVVVGVVKDFHFRPLNYRIGPLAFRNYIPEVTILNARIFPGMKDTALAGIEAIWKKLDPVHSISMKMMDEEIDQAYIDSGFTDALTVTGYIAFIAVCLACLGMLGMAMYSTQIRVKEIGVRKVMGASVSEVVLLLSKSFLQLIGLAIVIGAPVSYFLGNLSLQAYAYRITITPLLILSGIALITLPGVIAIGSQTVKAATANPVDSLRYE